MSDMTPIEKPWIIVHEMPDRKMQTLLAGPPGASYEQFSLAIADIIRHVARAFNVDEADVLHWAEREIHSPTTDIENPS